MNAPLALAGRVLLESSNTTISPTAAPTMSAEDGKDMLSTFSAVMSNILLFFLIFGMSATVRVQDLRHQLTSKCAIITGVAMQFIFMPFLGFCSVMLLKDSPGFTEAMGLSLLVVTASPGGSYSNWWCSLFNAELALSVAMTSVSSILSVGLLPANLFFYSWLAYDVIIGPEELPGEDLDVVGALDFDAIFITLAVVLSAILGGIYVGYKYDNAHFHKRANQFGSCCGLLLILFSAFLGSGGGDADTNFWSFDWSFYVGVALPCILGMTLANIVARGMRLTPPEVVAISIECCYQNTAIATSVAVTMFSDPDQRAEAVSVPLFYGFVEAILIGIYCLWAWKVGWTKAPADEKLCVVVTKSYEIDPHAEEEEWEGDLPTGWFARLFVPKEVERQHCAAAQETAPAKLNLQKSTTDDETSRDRLESLDVTVATSGTTPPGTPGSSLQDSNMELILQGSSADDVEMQSPAKGSLLYPKYRIDEHPDGYPSDEFSPPTSYADLVTTNADSSSSAATTPADEEQNVEVLAPDSLLLPAGPSLRDVVTHAPPPTDQ